ncbi:MAG: hypothetical protein QM723_32885 [Myxococcaceae bacterium]
MAAQNETLIEQVVGAHRERDVDGRVRSLPAWHDLDAAERLEAFEAARVQRKIEAALDAGGLSTTIKAVLSRLRR